MLSNSSVPQRLISVLTVASCLAFALPAWAQDAADSPAPETTAPEAPAEDAAPTEAGADEAAAAEEPAVPEGGLSIELNKLDARENGCLFTFVVENELETSFDKASYEVVLFNGEGVVQRLTVLDFQEVPAGSTRVRQFNLPDTDCADVSRLLINQSASCEGEGVQPGTCMRALTLESRADVEFSN